MQGQMSWCNNLNAHGNDRAPKWLTDQHQTLSVETGGGKLGTEMDYNFM